MGKLPLMGDHSRSYGDVAHDLAEDKGDMYDPARCYFSGLLLNRFLSSLVFLSLSSLVFLYGLPPYLLSSLLLSRLALPLYPHLILLLRLSPLAEDIVYHAVKALVDDSVDDPMVVEIVNLAIQIIQAYDLITIKTYFSLSSSPRSHLCVSPSLLLSRCAADLLSHALTLSRSRAARLISPFNLSHALTISISLLNLSHAAVSPSLSSRGLTICSISPSPPSPLPQNNPSSPPTRVCLVAPPLAAAALAGPTIWIWLSLQLSSSRARRSPPRHRLCGLSLQQSSSRRSEL
ncbi:hypothetical protein Syun_011818 [Stephania yunnanensis]|uniref:Uncharacterized protein n=1 Tax=Stephania yunnanensis TaxID=152371 RepID=A0AAP0PEP5_9MAGN